MNVDGPIHPTRITVPGCHASGWVVLDGPNDYGILGVVYADRDKAERTAKRHGCAYVSVSWPPLPGSPEPTTSKESAMTAHSTDAPAPSPVLTINVVDDMESNDQMIAALARRGLLSAVPDGKVALVAAREDQRLITDLIQARKDQGMSLDDLAERTGATTEKMRDFERLGADPTLSTVRRIARGLGRVVRHDVTDAADAVRGVDGVTKR